MSVKIRLQRHGKKGKPFFWIVAADARSKRDGKFLEKLGTYNPNTNPATIDLNVDQAVAWLHNGAQPTDTAKAILSYKGALLKHHLDGGVRKGALTQDQADAKLAAWLEEKTGKVGAKKDGLTKAQVDAKVKALKAETEANVKRAKAAAKAAEVTEEVVAEEVAVEEVIAEEVVAEEVVAEEAIAEEVVAEEAVAEEVVAEEAAVEEVIAEEVIAEEVVTEEVVTEEVVAEEVVAEVPAVEENNEETQA